MLTGRPLRLMSLLGARPVSLSVSPDCERDWQIRVATWPSSFSDWWTSIGRVGSSGKTSPAFVPHGAAQRRRVIWSKDESGSLRKRVISDASWTAWQNSGIVAPTEALTLNISVWPNAASVCSLSHILEIGGHLRRYCLSATACLGILRRAAKRGKSLPTMLHRALQQVVAASNAAATPEAKIPSYRGLLN